MMLVRVSSGKPILYRQTRVGKDWKTFTIFKIRTMIPEADQLRDKYFQMNEADGPVFKIKNDPRFTKIGKIIAFTGLDEILQLVNVIKGEMSLVGPRPLPVYEAIRIPAKYGDRFIVFPGMTSLWVISGSHRIPFRKWMEMDMEYIKEKSIQVDFQILSRTFLLVIKNIFSYLIPPII